MDDKREIQELIVQFNAAAKTLLTLDGVTFADEREHIEFTANSLDKAEQTLSVADITNARQALNLFKTHVHDKALLGTDALTGLPNRAAFNIQIRDTVKENGKTDYAQQNNKAQPLTQEQHRSTDQNPASNSYFALIFLDLDRFKGLNDTHGHQAGDAGLQAYANLLRKTLREGDTISLGRRNRAARLGGDEFTIIIHTTASNQEEAEENLNNARTRIEEKFAVQSYAHETKNFPLVSSMGMHIIEDGDTPETVLKKADKALYKHKKSKSSRYDYAVEQLQAQGVENLQIIPDPRATEATLREIQQTGQALQDLQNAGGLKIHVPAGTEPDSLKVLKDAGVTIVYDEPNEPETQAGACENS